MRRRGFTMLETVLAIAVGSLVLAAAMGVLATIRTSDRELAAQSYDMNDLARTQLAVREAIESLHAAPPGTVRNTFPDRTTDELNAMFNTAFPEPIVGLGARLEMTTGTNPRFEVVLNHPLLAMPRQTPVIQDAAGAAAGTRAEGSLARIGAEQLPGHRGAFELIRDERKASPDLWWVPLPPKDVPSGVVFDESTLPPAQRLCEDVVSLTWTAFIDRERVPHIRAIESRQFPAYIELEIETAGGGYGNWMFELGWTIGPELEAPPAAAATAPEGEGETGLAAPDIETEDVPREFDPDTMLFDAEEYDR